MKKLLALLMFAVTIFQFSPVVHAVVYWVAKTGSDSNACSAIDSVNEATDPGVYKLSIASAQTCMSTGDTLVIKAGTYNENITNPVGGTSFSSPTTIKRFQSDTVTVQGGSFSGASTGFIVLDGLRFNVTGLGRNEAVWIDQGAHHIRITNCEVLGSAGTAGIALYVGGFNEVLNTSIHNNGVDPSHDHGIYIKSGGNLIKGNDIFSNLAFGVHMYNGGANMGSGNQVIGNKIHGNAMAINVWDTTNAIVSGNLIYSNSGSNAVIGNCPCDYVGISNNNAAGTKVYNNTFWGNGATNDGSEIASGNADMIVRNNIFWNTGSNTILSGSTVNGNNLCASGCAVAGDPLFLNSASANFALNSGSPAIDQGTATIGGGTTRAFNGSAPDVGAHETIALATPTACTVASGDATHLRITFQNNVYPPLAGVSATGFTYRINGVAPNLNPVGATLVGNSRIDLTLNAALQPGQTIDFTYATTGTVRDSAVIGGTNNQRLNAIATQPCTNGVTGTVYFAAPSTAGSANGSSCANAFLVSTFLNGAVSGDVLKLCDGNYTGANSMIAIGNKSGTSGNPITIQAVNDGGATIDGEGVRNPVLFFNSSFWVIEGINAHNGVGDFSFPGEVIRMDPSSHDNIIRRVVAWDAGDTNSHVISTSGFNNLFEDVAGFGVGRKVFSFADSVGGGNICRRCWGRWEGSTNVGPKDTFELIYNSNSNKCENCIGTWDGGSMPANYTLQHNGVSCATLGPGVCGSPPEAPTYAYTNNNVNQPYGVMAESDSAVPNYNGGVFGSIAYVLSASKFDAPAVVAFQQGGGGFTFRDVVSLLQGHAGQNAFGLLNGGSGLAITNATGISSSPDTIQGGWTQTNVEHGTSVGGVSSIYQGGTGADVCFRTVNGTLTSTPLWPWPMNQRIKDATTAAAQAGHQHRIYQGATPTLTLVTDPHAIEDVTATIESLFGAIPAACGGGTLTVTITAPTSNPTHTIIGSANNIVQLSGTSTQSGGAVAWSCDRCGSGSVTGTTSWTTTSITLRSGINIITVTGTDASNSVGSDVLSITFIPTFPGNSLVGAWGFEDGSGVTAIDSSGNSNNGSLINGPQWVTGGRYARALAFDGTNDSVNVADSNSLDLTQSFTITAWVQPSAVKTDFRSLVAKNSLSGPEPMYELFSSVSGQCGSGGIAGLVRVNGTSGPTYIACHATPLALSVWTHLAVTYDGANLKLYKNGVLLTTTPVTGYMEPSDQILQIGASQFGENFQGVIDEVRIYNWGLPLTAASNTVFGTNCTTVNRADSISSPSITGDANCPVIPLIPPSQLKVTPAATGLKFSASSTAAKLGNQ